MTKQLHLKILVISILILIVISMVNILIYNIKAIEYISFSDRNLLSYLYYIKSLSTNKLILIAPCAILSSRKNNGGKHGNDKAENMGNNG